MSGGEGPRGLELLTNASIKRTQWSIVGAAFAFRLLGYETDMRSMIRS